MTGKKGKDRLVKMINQYDYEAKFCSHSLSGVRPRCRCPRGTRGEDATCQLGGEMKRFITEKTGPDSERIWEIRTMNRCYHCEARCQGRCRARGGRIFMIEKALFRMGLQELRVMMMIIL